MYQITAYSGDRVKLHNKFGTNHEAFGDDLLV